MRLRRLISCLVFVGAITLGGGVVRTGLLYACGEDLEVCGDDEKCCEHKVGTFCANESCASVHAEGQCVPKEKSCDEYWCGNQQCKSTWLISRDVCCVYYQSENAPEYTCKSSEVSCKGNNSRLTIRPTNPTLASSEMQSGS